MRREVWRERRIDAFSIGIDELRQFCTRLQAAFGGQDDVPVTVTAAIAKHEEVRFDPRNVDVGELPVRRFTKFTVGLVATSKSFFLDTDMYPFSVGVRSSSDDEAWCAGMNEVAVSFLRNHRVWYYWLVRGPVWWTLGLVSFFAVSTLLAGSDERTTMIRWLSLLGSGMFFGAKKNLLAHAAVELRGRRQLGFMEVATLVGILASVIAAVAAMMDLVWKP